MTATMGLAVAGLAVAFLGVLGVDAANGFAQAFALRSANAWRDVVVTQAATNAGLALVGLLLSVAASGRARLDEDHRAGVLATAGITVACVGLLLQAALIVSAFVQGVPGGGTPVTGG